MLFSSASESSESKSNTSSSNATSRNDVGRIASELSRLNRMLGDTHKNIARFEEFVKNKPESGENLDLPTKDVKHPPVFSKSFQVEQDQLNNVLKDLASAVSGLSRMERPLFSRNDSSSSRDAKESLDQSARLAELEQQLLQKECELDKCRRELELERNLRIDAESKIQNFEQNWIKNKETFGRNFNNIDKEKERVEMPVREVSKVNKACQTKGMNKPKNGKTSLKKELNVLYNELRLGHEEKLAQVRMALLQIQSFHEESENNYRRILNHLGLEIDVSARLLHLLINKEELGEKSKYVETLTLSKSSGISAWFNSVKLLSQWLRAQIIAFALNDQNHYSFPYSLRDNFSNEDDCELIEETVKQQERIFREKNGALHQLIERVS